MGYGYYTVITRDGREIEAGYLVSAECDRSACEVTIDRGLDALCGETPGGDEYGCGRYFCDTDLFILPCGHQVCGRCRHRHQC
ncbi:hypothetical protein GA0115251_109524 [Streptomyces sp. TverLS-915]|uniref:hypothetical protein n=1 Tax=Streptomyces sp. TverLS-915 TaxID=1839763 RepID=UPI00081F2776|nr:hypothetical protein [Streptomyces sp. TverLS-915]SCD49059.1 hypothetical protein GA0115251_109524 [Streptomyces sp. TverLS-915]